MGRIKGKIILFLFLGLSLHFPTWAQSSDTLNNTPAASPLPLSKPVWDTLRQGIDYTGGKQIQQEKPPKEEELTSEEWNRIISFLGKALAIIAAITLISILIAKSLGAGPLIKRNRKLEAASIQLDDLNQIEDQLMDTELSGLIQQAIREGRYALAVRLYYLATIKLLAEKEHITWKRGKTNRAYAMEIKNPMLQKEFNQITHFFEWVWYGDHMLSADTFHEVEPSFKALLQEIASTHKSPALP